MCATPGAREILGSSAYSLGQPPNPLLNVAVAKTRTAKRSMKRRRRFCRADSALRRLRQWWWLKRSRHRPTLQLWRLPRWRG
eukprot:5646481-Pleurochrysis_carterae.AAC.1